MVPQVMGARRSCEMEGGRWVRRRVTQVQVYLTPEQVSGLAELSHRTHIPRSEIVRAGIELLLVCARGGEPR